MYEQFKKRITIVCGLTAVVALLVTLIDVFFNTQLSGLFLDSTLFNILLFIVLWITGPTILKFANIDTEQYTRPHTVLFLGAGLLIILIINILVAVLT